MVRGSCDVSGKRMKEQMIAIILCLLVAQWAHGGHEVLYNFPSSRIRYAPESIAVVQFDSRPLTDYWQVGARWNRAYCEQYGHQYLFITQREEERAKGCRNREGEKLGSSWCKVYAMLHAMEVLPAAQAFVFLDSDALMTVNSSLSIMLSFIQKDLAWNEKEKPLAFNQDGPGYACKVALSLSYKVCFNSGVVVWFREENNRAHSILTEWWLSSSGRENSRFKMNWKKKWPWEQAVQHSLFEKYSDVIQVVSFPALSFLPWTSTKNPRSQYPTDTIEPYCLSHWPGANCFITHFCASKRQKQKIIENYDTIEDDREIVVTYLPEMGG